MIQFIKGYQFRKRFFVIGTKVSLGSKDEEDLIQRGFAVKTRWTGKTEKLKTNFFKPK